VGREDNGRLFFLLEGPELDTRFLTLECELNVSQEEDEEDPETFRESKAIRTCQKE
jgi:hypothetical protein